MLVSVPWAFSLSALSLRGIKLYTWNALTVGHQHVSTWPETQVPVRLYPDARNSSSQQEPAHGHAAWEISFPTCVFFIFDYNDLKGFSTASTTVQGVKPVVLSGTRPSALLVLSAPAAGRRRLEPRSAFSTMTGKGPVWGGSTIHSSAKLVQVVHRCVPQEAPQSKLIFCLHFIGAGPQGIQPIAKT